jgi:hypothetical protein
LSTQGLCLRPLRRRMASRRGETHGGAVKPLATTCGGASRRPGTATANARAATCSGSGTNYRTMLVKFLLETSKWAMKQHRLRTTVAPTPLNADNSSRLTDQPRRPGSLSVTSRPRNQPHTTDVQHMPTWVPPSDPHAPCRDTSGFARVPSIAGTTLRRRGDRVPFALVSCERDGPALWARSSQRGCALGALFAGLLRHLCRNGANNEEYLRRYSADPHCLAESKRGGTVQPGCRDRAWRALASSAERTSRSVSWRWFIKRRRLRQPH